MQKSQACCEETERERKLDLLGVKTQADSEHQKLLVFHFLPLKC